MTYKEFKEKIVKTGLTVKEDEKEITVLYDFNAMPIISISKKTARHISTPYCGYLGKIIFKVLRISLDLAETPLKERGSLDGST